MKKKILLVGCGNLGYQLLSICNNYFSVYVYDNDKKKMSLLKKKKKIKLFELKNKNPVFDYVVLCIKPISFKKKSFKITHLFSKNQIVLSFMAGLTIDQIIKSLTFDSKVIRIMPNIYSSLGEGVTGIFCKKNLKRKIKNDIENLTKYFGETIWLKKESDINFITAFFGGGPAYFFLFLKTLKDILKKKIKDKGICERLILKLLIGTNKYIEKNDMNFSLNISKVASKGGTTEKAINYLNQNKKFQNLLYNAINLAEKKSREMSLK